MIVMLLSNYLFKKERWKSKEKYCSYKKIINSIDIENEYSIISDIAIITKNHRYLNFNDTEFDEIIFDALFELPYLIFADEDILHQMKYIEFACKNDKDILSVMLQLNDSELNALILDHAFISRMVCQYGAVIHQKDFNDELLFFELIKNDLFKLRYYETNQEMMLDTEEGKNFLFDHYKNLAECYKKDMIRITHLQKHKDFLMEFFNFSYTVEEEITAIVNRVNEDELYFIDLLERTFDFQEEINYEILDTILQRAIIDAVGYVFDSGKKLNHIENITTAIDRSLKNEKDRSNLPFYIDCAKRGYPALALSRRCFNDYFYWIEVLKINPSLFPYTPKKMRQDSVFVFSVRYVCEDALCYCDPILLDDEDFILRYLAIFDPKNYFHLGKNLSKNVKFLKKAVQLDPYVLFYADEEIKKNQLLKEEFSEINLQCLDFFF